MRAFDKDLDDRRLKAVTTTDVRPIAAGENFALSAVDPTHIVAAARLAPASMTGETEPRFWDAPIMVPTTVTLAAPVARTFPRTIEEMIPRSNVSDIVPVDSAEDTDEVGGELLPFKVLGIVTTMSALLCVESESHPRPPPPPRLGNFTRIVLELIHPENPDALFVIRIPTDAEDDIIDPPGP